MKAQSRRAVMRTTLGGAAAGMLALPPHARAAEAWHNIDVTGDTPDLAFTMMDTTTGKTVTAADFRGKIVMLYLGYTFCPDVCPLSMGRVSDVLDRLGPQADDVRLLFATVDPGRDTVSALHEYTAAFGPYFVGLRGSEDAIARLARRYRLAYSVTPAITAPAADARPYEVTHTSAIYVFGKNGKARLLVPSLGSTTPDLDGTTDDLRRLVQNDTNRGWLSRLMSAL